VLVIIFLLIFKLICSCFLYAYISLRFSYKELFFHWKSSSIRVNISYDKLITFKNCIHAFTHLYFTQCTTRNMIMFNTVSILFKHYTTPFIYPLFQHHTIIQNLDVNPLLFPNDSRIERLSFRI
jgi:hypothetical protein